MSRKWKIELMKEIEELKKRLIDIVVSIKEKKSFQLGYLELKKIKCFSCGRIGHIAKNCRSKADGNRSSVQEENFPKDRSLGKETWG